MPSSTLAFSAVTFVVALSGCGSSPASPPATRPAAAEPDEPGDETLTAADASTAPVAPSAADPKYDVVRGKDAFDLKPLFDKKSLPPFPPATVSEGECWRTTGVTGVAKPDYETLLARCGASTGAVQYTRPAIGHLHHKHQRRDVYNVPIVGGLCYRFFGVGDATINDLDIIIEQRGALVGDDKTTGPVAIIESDKAWCIDHDGAYSFHVQTHGEGKGQYVFGIWARKGSAP